MVQIISLTVGPNGRWHPRICSMAVVWTFDVPDAGTRRVFSTEDKIWDGQTTTVSATVGRTLGASRGVRGQIRTRGGRLGEDFKAASLQRHFWVQNAPYAVKDRGNPLKSQQMRPPSERTTPTFGVEIAKLFSSNYYRCELRKLSERFLDIACFILPVVQLDGRLHLRHLSS